MFSPTEHGDFYFQKENKIMNYKRIYDQLIQKRIENRLRPLDGYSEKHHIIPLSFGGTDDWSNKVRLTAKEHFVAHLLLLKWCETEFGLFHKKTEQMYSALLFFSSHKTNHKLTGRKNLRITGKLFDQIRQKFGKISSNKMMGKLVGPKNGMYGRKRTDEEKRKMSETRIFLGSSKGSRNPMYGVSLNDILSEEEIKLWHQRQSASLSGPKNPAYGRKWMHLKGSTKKEDRVYVKPDQIDHYLKLGYIFGSNIVTRPKKIISNLD